MSLLPCDAEAAKLLSAIVDRRHEKRVTIIDIDADSWRRMQALSRDGELPAAAVVAASAAGHRRSCARA